MDDQRFGFRCRLLGLHGNADGFGGFDFFAAAGKDNVHRIDAGDRTVHGAGDGAQHLFGCHGLDSHDRICGEGPLGRLGPHAQGFGFVDKFLVDDHVLQGDDLARVGIFGQQAVAHQPIVIPVVMAVGDLVVGVALDGVDALLLVHFGHDAHVIGTVVVVILEENQIAGTGQTLARGQEHLPRGQLVHPGFAVGLVGEGLSGNSGIVQAEGYVHGAPVAVGAAVPGAVAGVALGDGRADLIVQAAFGVAQLAFRHGEQVVRPDAGEGLGQGGLPCVAALQIGFGVGVAGQGVRMLGLIAGEDLFVAFLRMAVAFGFLASAGQLCDRLVTVLGMGVAFTLLQGADQLCDRLIALLAVGMVFVLLQRTNQRS